MAEDVYIRDGRAPLPEKESTSRVMRANKAKDTLPELSLRRALWRESVRGYRVNYKKAPGRPDIAFPARKIAIFVNGCFWHRCPFCHPGFPKSHKAFWKKKFDKNIRRDKEKTEELEKNGWKVLSIWECQLKNDLQQSVLYVKELISLTD